MPSTASRVCPAVPQRNPGAPQLSWQQQRAAASLCVQAGEEFSEVRAQTTGRAASFGSGKADFPVSRDAFCAVLEVLMMMVRVRLDLGILFCSGKMSYKLVLGAKFKG